MIDRNLNNAYGSTKLLICALVFVISFGIVSCGNKVDTRVIVVSIEPQRALLEQIVGERFEVKTLLPSGANPETFEPTIKTRKEVDDAIAYFTIGAMPFEDNIAKTLSDGVMLVNVSDGITPIFGTHDHCEECAHTQHHHGMADPHTWTSVKNARVIAKNMFDVVVKIDPQAKDYYTERYNKLVQRLDSLDSEYARRLQSKPRNAFAVWHPSLSYFARDYGLKQISVGFENKEISPARMADVTKNIRAEGVEVLFFQKEYDSRQAQSLSNELGIRFITINPLDYDWEGQLEIVIKSLE